jgi:hypothetical protein
MQGRKIKLFEKRIEGMTVPIAPAVSSTVFFMAKHNHSSSMLDGEIMKEILLI